MKITFDALGNLGYKNGKKIPSEINERELIADLGLRIAERQKAQGTRPLAWGIAFC